MLVEFEIDSATHETPRRVATNPDCAVMVEQHLPNGAWGDAITKRFLLSVQASYS